MPLSLTEVVVFTKNNDNNKRLYCLSMTCIDTTSIVTLASMICSTRITSEIH